MQLIIPTRGRTDQQHTLQQLPGELRKQTSLVCPKDEASSLDHLYKSDGVEIVIQPDPDWTIARKRKWIIEEYHRVGHDKIMMLDDDLTFSTRRSPEGTGLRVIRGEELIPEFERIGAKLGPEFPHAGFGPRLHNDKKEAGWEVTGARNIYSLGYYLPIVVRECVLGRIETREDMDLTLQLLRKGYHNAVWQTTVVNQLQYDGPGGATNERTIERSDADCYKLKRLHPGYVRVVQKDYTDSVPRKEVKVQWKKALEDGLRERHRKK
jgi:hypothetical protein